MDRSAPRAFFRLAVFKPNFADMLIATGYFNTEQFIIFCKIYPVILFFIVQFYLTSNLPYFTPKTFF